MSPVNNSSTSRQQILAKVREALAVPSDVHVKPKPTLRILNSETATREFLPHVGESLAERFEVFSTLSEKLKTELILVPSNGEATRSLGRLVKEHNWKKVAYHDHPLVVSSLGAMDVARLDTGKAYSKQDLEACEVGVSACDALIAQTASALVTNPSAGGRALSVLPPHHVVIATEDQLVATMNDGYSILRSRYADQWPSFISCITGPSRTADIERVLVLGAHGPKRLTILLIAPSLCRDNSAG